MHIGARVCFSLRLPSSFSDKLCPTLNFCSFCYFFIIKWIFLSTIPYERKISSCTFKFLIFLHLCMHYHIPTIILYSQIFLRVSTDIQSLFFGIEVFILMIIFAFIIGTCPVVLFCWQAFTCGVSHAQYN